MPKPTKEQTAKLEALKAELETARRNREQNNNAETRAAYSDAWNACNAYACEIQPPKGWGRGSRAGRRQAAERRSR